MSYHTHRNFKMLLQSDLSNKLNKGWHCLEFMDRECNCYSVNKDQDGKCIYGRICRNRNLVYKVTCTKTGKFYIGSTMTTLKKRMEGHMNDVKKIMDGKDFSDTFATHFSKVYTNLYGTEFDINKLKKLFTYNILWSSNLLSIVKKYGTLDCRLCAEERINILFSGARRRNLMLNKSSDIYCPCRHKGAFHRYISTDELLRRKGIFCETAWGRGTPPSIQDSTQIVNHEL